MDRAFWAVFGFAAAAPLVVTAQGTQFDAALSYSARDEVTLPDRAGEFDNDIALLTTGLSWGAGDGRMRGALEVGFTNNDDWNDDYSSIYGGELLFTRKVGNQRFGLGGRVRAIDELTTSTEVAYSIEHIGSAIDLRGLLGLQLLADEEKVPGREDAGVFAQGEATFYPSNALAVSAGLLADNDGEAYGAAVEYRPRGWGMSFFLDYSQAFNDYRGFDEYDEFTGGIRFVPGSSSLKSQRQGNVGRVMQRYMQAQ